MSERTISDEYRDLYRQLYASGQRYGVNGYRWARRAARVLRDKIGAARVVDYGCGRGTLADALEERGFKVTRFEPGLPEFSASPESADAVVSTDVLEHVEPEMIDAVLRDIRRLGPKGAFLVIATRRGKRRLPDGSDPHRLVRSAGWWREKLHAHYGTVITGPETTAGEFVAECYP